MGGSAQSCVAVERRDASAAGLRGEPPGAVHDVRVDVAGDDPAVRAGDRRDQLGVVGRRTREADEFAESRRGSCPNPRGTQAIVASGMRVRCWITGS